MNEKRAKQSITHRGLHDYRLEHDPRGLETAFAKLWEKECKDGRYCTLLLQEKGYYSPGLLNEDCKVPFKPISQRDATVAATVIQWLGSNVGFCFLEMALKAAGYEIRRIEK